jgi:hypothetical protein
MRAAGEGRDWKSLFLILAGAAATRFIGLGFGLPHQGVRPDELTLIARVMNFFSGDLNPRFFSYPSLQMYLLFAAYKAYYFLGGMLGRFHSLDEFLGAYANAPAPFYLISRGISALLGTLSILVVHRICVMLLGRMEALIAAFFLAFAYLHARDSHFGTTDVPVTFFVITAYAAMASGWSKPSFGRTMLAGLFAGLATSTKYMGILLWVPMALALWSTLESQGRHRYAALARHLSIFGFAFAAAFIAGSPFALVQVARLRGDFFREVRAVWTEGYPLPPGWIYHFTFSLRHGLGIPLLGAALAGCLVLARADWRKAIFLLSFPLSYYALMGRGTRDFVRYAIPLVPFLCITAAVFVIWLHRRAVVRLPPAASKLAPAALAVVLIFPSLHSLVSFDALLLREDTRVAARRYVEGSAPAGATVAEFHSDFGEMELSPTPTTLRRLLETQPGKPAENAIARARIGAVEAGAPPGYRLWLFDPGSQSFMEEGIPVAGNPDLLVLEESPLRFYQAEVPAEIRRLAGSYSLKRTFRAFGELGPTTVFNEMDAFYLPFAGFTGYLRPGPNIFVYEKMPRNLLGL